MTHVVERCPACGVEHERPTGGACEACGTPLRAWCRAHSREIGWLDACACARCAEDATRPAPRQSAPAALPCPDFSRAAAGAPLARKVESAAAPRAKPRGLAGMVRMILSAAEVGTPGKVGSATEPLGLAGHLTVMTLMMLITAGGGTMLGVIAGFVAVFSGRGAAPDTALRFALGGAVAGLIVGGLCCVHYLWNLRRHPPER